MLLWTVCGNMFVWNGAVICLFLLNSAQVIKEFVYDP